MFEEQKVIRVGKIVLGYFITLSTLAYFAKLLPFDPRILLSLIAVSLTFFVLVHWPSRYALCLLFANYLSGVHFYQAGQLYPIIAVVCLFCYLNSRRRSVRPTKAWRRYLTVWLVGGAISAIHATGFLGADGLVQFVGIQEYVGCAAAFVLGYIATREQRADEEALIALGWMGVVTAILAWLVVFDIRLARQVVPGVGALVYGHSSITPFGHIPKLAIGVEGVALAGFMAGAVGLALLATRRAPRWVGLTILFSGAITSVLIYRRSIILGFLLVLLLVLLHYFGKSRKRRLAFVLVGLGVMGLFLFAGDFLATHFGQEYWMPYGEETLLQEARIDRLLLWRTVWSDIERNPWLGLGPRFYSQQTHLEFDREFESRNTHNIALFYLLALGFPLGLLCSVVLLATAVRTTATSLLSRTHQEPEFSLAVLGAFFGALVFFGLFGDIQRIAPSHVLVWALLGISAALLRQQRLYRRVKTLRAFGNPVRFREVPCRL